MQPSRGNHTLQPSRGNSRQVWPFNKMLPLHIVHWWPWRTITSFPVTFACIHSLSTLPNSKKSAGRIVIWPFKGNSPWLVVRISVSSMHILSFTYCSYHRWRSSNAIFEWASMNFTIFKELHNTENWCRWIRRFIAFSFF